MDSKNPVVAHRGAWKKNGLPENSIAALKRAIQLKCAGAEFDVRMTKDEILVINHDPHHHGLAIEQSTYADLKQITLSNQEQLPTLEEYIQAGKKKNKTTRLIVEIKPSETSTTHGQRIAEKVYQLLKLQKVLNQVTIISFDIEILKKIIALDSNVKTQYLNGDVSPSEIYALGISGIDYHHSVFLKEHPQWIEEAKKLNLQLNVWTVNQKEDLLYFLKLGFDQITTNEPELLFTLLPSK